MKNKKEHFNKKKHKIKIDTFTKAIVVFILLNAQLEIWCSYILAYLYIFYGTSAYEAQIAQDLSIAIVTQIIAVPLGYFVKSFKETKEEKANEITMLQQGLNNEETNNDKQGL